MEERIKTTLGLFLASALILMAIATINLVSAQETTIQVDPPEIIDLTLTPDTSFTVNISISDVAEPGVFAYQFRLYYDNTLLEGTQVVLPEGHFLKPALAPGNIFITALAVNQEEGYVEAAITLMGDEPGKTGSGVLVTITFNVIGVGSCALDISDSLFADPTINEIPHSIIDGYFSNKAAAPPAKLSVDPPTVSDPALAPNQTFTINITIAEIENLYGYEFKLGYNTSVLDCTSVTIYAIQNETNFTPEHSIDDAAGTVWVNVTYYSPAEPITSYAPATMASITFQVMMLGGTILDLYDTNLVDQLDEPIEHDVSDGYFSNLAVRDLAIVDVILSRTQAYENFELKGIEFIIDITVIVRNGGDTTETFDLSTYYNDTLIETQTISDLNPNTNATLTFHWDTTDLPLYVNYTIKAYAHEVLGEISTDNNVYIVGPVVVSMFGDTNLDKKVDIQDVAEAAKAFGSYSGHKRWNPNSDLNNDDIISVTDIVLIAMNFGRVY